MKTAARRALLPLLLLSLAIPAGAQNYYVYSPRPAVPGEKGTGGILVREIEIRRGDTLSGISRQYSGRGSYYPQILLFNDIRNPHRIREGEQLRVPVGRSDAAQPPRAASAAQPSQRPQPQAATAVQPSLSSPTPAGRQPDELSLNELKTSTAPKKSARSGRAARKKSVTSANRRRAAAVRKQFDRAQASFRRGEWATALARYDRFLADHPASPLAAEASLRKADCYLKLSGQ